MSAKKTIFQTFSATVVFKQISSSGRINFYPKVNTLSYLICNLLGLAQLKSDGSIEEKMNAIVKEVDVKQFLLISQKILLKLQYLKETLGKHFHKFFTHGLKRLRASCIKKFDRLFQLCCMHFSASPINSYLFKVNNRNPRKRYEICSKLTIKTPERLH